MARTALFIARELAFGTISADVAREGTPVRASLSKRFPNMEASRKEITCSKAPDSAAQKKVALGESPARHHTLPAREIPLRRTDNPNTIG